MTPPTVVSLLKAPGKRAHLISGERDDLTPSPDAPDVVHGYARQPGIRIGRIQDRAHPHPVAAAIEIDHGLDVLPERPGRILAALE